MIGNKIRTWLSRPSPAIEIPDQGETGQEELAEALQLNIDKLKAEVGNSTDVVIRELTIDALGGLQCAVLFTDGLVNSDSLQNFVIRPLLREGEQGVLPAILPEVAELPQYLEQYVLCAGEVQHIGNFTELYTHLMSGDTVILLEGCKQGIAVDTRGWQERGVTEPSTQSVVRGPKEGFTENYRTNTMLIRRKIKSHRLWLESLTVGTLTKTDVGIMYIQSVANQKVVEEVRKRLQRIDIDGILETGNIEELIQDETYSPFPTLYNTERPDAAAAGLLEGRVVIVVDGTPFVLLAPALFVQFYQAPEDYYQRADFATVIRLLRYACFFIALVGPSFYIAVTTFHHEMLPAPLLIGLAAQREGIPFPAFVEALTMEVTFEILREAGVRLPKSVGQTVSIVGALVIGQAAVEAGLVSAAMVIVVSLTAISNFVLPSFNMAISIRMLRFVLMMFAASFGLFGVTVGLIAIVVHLCSLRSFGVPYMTPMAPFIVSDQKDTILRLPQWFMMTRPRLVSQKNPNRKRNVPGGKPNQGSGGGS